MIQSQGEAQRAGDRLKIMRITLERVRGDEENNELIQSVRG